MGEVNTHNPFVRACNYAPDKPSHVNIGGLPQCPPEEHQIVFVRNRDRWVKSHSHQRESLVRPDIVLLRWGYFKSLVSGPSTMLIPYSHSYLSKICTSASKCKLSWRSIRSTVEVKPAALRSKATSNLGLPARHSPCINVSPRRSGGFRRLFSSIDGDRSSGRLTKTRAPATAENVPIVIAMSKNSKRKLKDLRQR